MAPRKRSLRRRALLSRRARVALAAFGGLALAGVLLALLAPVPDVVVPDAGDRSPRASIYLAYDGAIPSADASPLVRPVGVAIGGGRVYVADSVDAVVRVFDQRGRERAVIGRGVLEIPTYVTLDPRDGTVLVSDRSRREVLRFDADGASLEPLAPRTPPTEGGEGTPVAWEPLGIDVTDDGTVYAADVAGAHRILVLDADGTPTGAIGGSLEASGGVSVSLDYPNAVRHRDDALWVADSNNRRVLAFAPDGSLTRVARVEGVARGFDFVDGAVDDGAAAGMLVCDALTSRIVLIALDGEELARFGGPGDGDGQLAYPNDLAVDAGGRRVYVADTGNGRIQVWRITDEPPAAAGAGAKRGRTSPMRIAGFMLLALSLLPLAVGYAASRSGGNEPRVVE